MADTAARLTDVILPSLPVRQWVLSLPYEIRYRLAWDGKLIAAVLAIFLRVVYDRYRRQARQQGYGDPRCGSVTFVQRFGSALNLNPRHTRHVGLLPAMCLRTFAINTVPNTVPNGCLHNAFDEEQQE